MFLLFLLVFLSGCSGGATSSSISSGSSMNDAMFFEPQSNELISIYDIHHEVIGQIEHYGPITQTDDSIIYAKIPTGTANRITEMDYYRYVFSTKENIKLGTVEDWAYEANYSNCLVNNHLYMLITTGNIYDDSGRMRELYTIDLNQDKMSKLFSVKGGYPYVAMEAVENKLLMTDFTVTGCDLEEYDTETGKKKTLMHFDYDNDTHEGAVIRQLATDQNTVSLLMLESTTNNEEVWLRLDTYDHDMNLLRSVDLSSIAPNDNELCQLVGRFFVFNEDVYYENFSSTRFLGKIEGDTVNPIMETDVAFVTAAELIKNENTSLFYRTFSYDAENAFYLLNHENGTIKKAVFHADDERYNPISFSRDTNNTLLIGMDYQDPNTGEELPPGCITSTSRISISRIISRRYLMNSRQAGLFWQFRMPRRISFWAFSLSMG